MAKRLTERDIAPFIEHKPFVTAAGLEANQKIELDLLTRKNRTYTKIIDLLVEWAVAEKVGVITAVPNGGNRYAADVSRESAVPLLTYVKQGKDFKLFSEARGGEAAFRSGVKLGIVEDVRSTGFSVLRVAQLACGEVTACTIIDRGQHVAGIESLEAAQAYSQSHPDEPPAHITTPFPYAALLAMPLALRAHEA